MNKQAEYQRRYEEIVALSMLDETEAEYVVNEANRIASKASELDLPQPIKTALFFTASSIALNFACESDDPELIKRGQELAERALRATIPALQVTRSTYLHLIDLVAMWNHPDDHQGEYHDYPDFRYMNDPEADDALHLLEHSLQEPDDADADQAQSDGRDTD